MRILNLKGGLKGLLFASDHLGEVNDLLWRDGTRVAIIKEDGEDETSVDRTRVLCETCIQSEQTYLTEEAHVSDVNN